MTSMKRFESNQAQGYREAVPGISQKTLIYGEKTLMAEFLLQAGRILPNHEHPYEQTGYLVKGHIQLRIADETFDVHPGDAWCIPVNVPHGAKIIEDSVAIEVFSPRRDDYVTKAEDKNA